MSNRKRKKKLGVSNSKNKIKKPYSSSRQSFVFFARTSQSCRPPFVTGAFLSELVAAVRAGASLPELVAAACACGLQVSQLHARANCGCRGCGWVRRGAGGTRLGSGEGRGWVQGRLAVGFSLRW